MIGQGNHDVHNENIDSVTHRGCYGENTKNLNQGKNPHVGMHTLVENIVSKARSEVHNMMTTAKFKIQDAVLTAIDNLLILEWNWL